MCALPVTATETTVGAAGAEYAAGVTRPKNASTASAMRGVRRNRSNKRRTSFVREGSPAGPPLATAGLLAGCNARPAVRVPGHQGTTYRPECLYQGVLSHDRKGEPLSVRQRLDPLDALRPQELVRRVDVAEERRIAVLGEVVELHRRRRVGPGGEAGGGADRVRQRLAEAGVDVAVTDLLEHVVADAAAVVDGQLEIGQAELAGEELLDRCREYAA